MILDTIAFETIPFHKSPVLFSPTKPCTRRCWRGRLLAFASLALSVRLDGSAATGYSGISGESSRRRTTLPSMQNPLMTC